MADQIRELHSWKEIAAYLERSEKTVRRWEKSRRLPVRRVSGVERDTVFVTTAELDAWMGRQGHLNGDGDAPEPPSGALAEYDASGPSDVQPDASFLADPAASPVRGWLKSRVVLAAIVICALVLVWWAGHLRTLRGATLPDRVPGGERPVVVLKISPIGEQPVELSIVEGESGRTGGSAERPSVLLWPRLERTALALEIRRSDGRPIKPGGRGAEPAVILLQPNAAVRVFQPFIFDVEWVRTEGAPRPSSRRP